ncbi:MAG TPA: 3-dehydro-L-gulonate 2-dehydrogenase [Acidobacteriaceae bacterium]|jgi:3-dehydro-L-gulonate 2-dehydrogenase|nr:3-dehydro-L-gulonate 2-dehydrogenase [Acidobacteriaceae bacterium]
MEIRIPFDELYGALRVAMLRLGFAEERAELCARLFAETTRDGVYTHGLNRLPRFVASIQNGTLNVTARAEKTGGVGAFERWTGNRAAGNLSAHECMSRAVELAAAHGIGCVALRDTNHWLRAGTYGWLAADAGVIGMCWTNTMPNLVPWGGVERGIGNNPIVIAVPRLGSGETRGAHVVLDMAISQYSFGAIAGYIARGEQTPFDGGYDAAGNITRDPKLIEASQGGLPIGYWKGSGLSVLLDLTAAILSAGRATCELSDDPMKESGQSQVFLAFDVKCFGDDESTERIANEVVDALHAVKGRDGKQPRYPGEQTLKLREENMRLGVPVVEARWKELLELVK